jgi:hypothetical protein
MKSEDPKQTNYNVNAGYPVKSYSNYQTGVKATAKTLLLPYYKNIVKALKEGKNTALAYQTSGIARELVTWGSRTFAKKFIDGANATKPSSKKPDPIKKDTGNNIVNTVVILLAVGVVIYLSIQNLNLFI